MVEEEDEVDEETCDGWMDGMDETRDLEGGREGGRGPATSEKPGGFFCICLFCFLCVRYEKEETAFVLRPLVQFGFRFQIRARSLCFFNFFTLIIPFSAYKSPACSVG
jgi:hypothetical protein